MKKNIIIAILIIVALIMGGSLVYLNMNKDKIGCNCSKSVPESTQPQEGKNTNEVKGLYTYTSESVYSESADSNIEPKYELYLYEDGTFEYCFSFPYSGHIGNYIIKDNKIILNYMFDTSTDVSLNYNGKTKTLLINENGTLTDNENEMSIVKKDTITLAKASNQEETKFLSNHNAVNKMIGESAISNNYKQNN